MSSWNPFFWQRGPMTYHPGDIFESMGRKWVLEREFEYSLNPSERYNRQYISKMRREWNYRLDEAHNIETDLRSRGLHRPKRRAIGMPLTSPQELNLALNRIREENNRMRLRWLRLEGHRLGLYVTPDWNSDCEMSDEDDFP